MKVSNLG